MFSLIRCRVNRKITITIRQLYYGARIPAGSASPCIARNPGVALRYHPGSDATRHFCGTSLTCRSQPTA